MESSMLALAGQLPRPNNKGQHRNYYKNAFIKGSKTMPNQDVTEDLAQPQRRGRPRKNPVVADLTPKKKRGRPRKEVDPNLPPVERKKRGRPRKPDAKYPTVADMKSFRRKWAMIDMMVHRDDDHPNGYSVEDMAKHFNVTTRTIRRDLKILDEIFGGLDVTQVRWGLKCYYLERIPFGENGAAITRDELVSLCIARQLMTPFQGTELGAHIDSGYEKLRSCLSKERVEYADKVASYFSNFNFSKPLESKQSEILSLLYKAMDGNKIVKFDYDSVNSGKSKTYEVHPYSFIYDKGFIYLAGYNCEKGRFQHWKLNRFTNAQVLPATFVRTNEFDPEKYAEKAVNLFISDNKPRRVILKFSERCALGVKELNLPTIKRSILKSNGSMKVEMFLDSKNPAFVNWILSFGSGVKIISPRSLRKDVCDKALTIRKKYS